MSLPFGIESSEKWFIELWNYTILPCLNDIVKMKIIINDSSNLNLKQNDPVDWIIKNYPWPKSQNFVPLNLRFLRLKLYECFLSKSVRSSSSSDDSDLNNVQIENTENSPNQHLVYFFEFILRLTKI